MTVKQMWEGYKAKCVHPEASEIQIQEIKQAFYAGFISMMEVNKTIGDPRFDEKKAVRLLDQLDKELQTFMQEKLTDVRSKSQSMDS